MFWLAMYLAVGLVIGALAVWWLGANDWEWRRDGKVVVGVIFLGPAVAMVLTALTLIGIACYLAYETGERVLVAVAAGLVPWLEKRFPGAAQLRGWEVSECTQCHRRMFRRQNFSGFPDRREVLDDPLWCGHCAWASMEAGDY